VLESVHADAKGVIAELTVCMLVAQFLLHGTAYDWLLCTHRRSRRNVVSCPLWLEIAEW